MLIFFLEYSCYPKLEIVVARNAIEGQVCHHVSFAAHADFSFPQL